MAYDHTDDRWCRNCAFWVPHRNGNRTGECHRRAPMLPRLSDDDSLVQWPHTKHYDFCGDWRMGWDVAVIRATPAAPGTVASARDAALDRPLPDG